MHQPMQRQTFERSYQCVAPTCFGQFGTHQSMTGPSFVEHLLRFSHPPFVSPYADNRRTHSRAGNGYLPSNSR